MNGQVGDMHIGVFSYNVSRLKVDLSSKAFYMFISKSAPPPSVTYSLGCFSSGSSSDEGSHVHGVNPDLA